TGLDTTDAVPASQVQPDRLPPSKPGLASRLVVAAVAGEARATTAAAPPLSSAVVPIAARKRARRGVIVPPRWRTTGGLDGGCWIRPRDAASRAGAGVARRPSGSRLD